MGNYPNVDNLIATALLAVLMFLGACSYPEVGAGPRLTATLPVAAELIFD